MRDNILDSHEKFLVERETNVHAAHYERGGVHYREGLPDEPLRLDGEITWVFPQRQRARRGAYDWLGKWWSPDPAIWIPLPDSALEMLWRDELAALCAAQRLSTDRRATRSSMMRSLRWMCSGKDLTRGICSALRARDCIEADPPIREEERVA